MALQFGLLVPQGWTMDLARIKDPVEAYETMTRVAQTAEEVGFASVAWRGQAPQSKQSSWY